MLIKTRYPNFLHRKVVIFFNELLSLRILKIKHKYMLTGTRWAKDSSHEPLLITSAI